MCEKAMRAGSERQHLGASVQLNRKTAHTSGVNFGDDEVYSSVAHRKKMSCGPPARKRPSRHSRSPSGAQCQNPTSCASGLLSI